MLKTFQTQFRHGKILFSNEIKIPENTVLYVSYKDPSENDFFLNASETALNNIWNNSEDDIYEQLLKK